MLLNFLRIAVPSVLHALEKNIHPVEWEGVLWVSVKSSRLIDSALQATGTDFLPDTVSF